MVTNVSSARGDSDVAATLEEYQAKVRVYTDKAAQYRGEAEDNRRVAKRYREAKNSKGHPISSDPAIRKLAANFEEMARHDDALAKDAERIAAFYERQARAFQAGKAAE